MLQRKLSTPTNVVLKKVGFKATGNYKCEVTSKQRNDVGYNGYHQRSRPFLMDESNNRMTVVGEGHLTQPFFFKGRISRNLLF